MGLDITAYSNLKAVGKHADGWCEDETHISVYAYDSFPQSFRGLPILGQRDDLLDAGCYARTEATKAHEFQAGSYGGYNAWRSDLQRQFNPDLTPDGPFYELIWFADNEGSIGPDAAADLFADFRAHAADYTPGSDFGDGIHAREKYADWTRAAELAADRGLIRFH